MSVCLQNKARARREYWKPVVEQRKAEEHFIRAPAAHARIGECVTFWSKLITNNFN